MSKSLCLCVCIYICMSIQPWILTGRTDAEAETPVFWSFDANSWLIGKVSDAGKDWGQKKRVSEDGMVGWHHGFNGHKLGKIQEMVKDLACCSPWGHKESDITGWHNNNTHTYIYIHFYFSNFCQCIYVYVYIYFLYFFVNVVMVGNYTWKKI